MLTYSDEKFLESKSHIRLLEIDGNFAGILRTYDEHGEQTESWVMNGLRVVDLTPIDKSLKATFKFHHALYMSEENEL